MLSGWGDVDQHVLNVGNLHFEAAEAVPPTSGNLKSLGYRRNPSPLGSSTGVGLLGMKEAWRLGMEVVVDDLSVTVAAGRKLLDHVAWKVLMLEVGGVCMKPQGWQKLALSEISGLSNSTQCSKRNFRKTKGTVWKMYLMHFAWVGLPVWQQCRHGAVSNS